MSLAPASEAEFHEAGLSEVPIERQGLAKSQARGGIALNLASFHQIVSTDGE
jgi:hypothetical protein